jgi:Ribbon-helix-helix domain
MSGEAQWTVSVSTEIDLAVRRFLFARGMQQSDLSRFIGDAVKWPVLDQTLAETRDKFADMEPDALDELLEEAVAAARRPGAG